MPIFDEFATLPPDVIRRQEEEAAEELRRRKSKLSTAAAEMLSGVSPQDLDTESKYDAAKRQKVEEYLNTSPWDASQREVSESWKSKGKLGKVGMVIAEALGAIGGNKDPYTRAYERKLEEYKTRAPQMRSALDQDERNTAKRDQQELAELKRNDQVIQWAMRFGLDETTARAKVDQLKSVTSLNDMKTVVEGIKSEQERTKADYMKKNGMMMGTTPASVNEATAINADPNVARGIAVGALARGVGKSVGQGDQTRTSVSSGRTRVMKTTDPLTGEESFHIVPLPPTTTTSSKGGGVSTNLAEGLQEKMSTIEKVFGVKLPASTSAATPPFQRPPATQQRPSMTPPTPPAAPKAPSVLGGAGTIQKIDLPKTYNSKLSGEWMAKQQELKNFRMLRSTLTNPEGYKNLNDFMGPYKNLPIMGTLTDFWRKARPAGKTSTETMFDPQAAEQTWTLALQKSGKALNQTEMAFAQKIMPQKAQRPDEAIRQTMFREALLGLMYNKERMGELLSGQLSTSINTVRRIEQRVESLLNRIKAGKQIEDDALTFEKLFPEYAQ